MPVDANLPLKKKYLSSSTSDSIQKKKKWRLFNQENNFGLFDNAYSQEFELENQEEIDVFVTGLVDTNYIWPPQNTSKLPSITYTTETTYNPQHKTIYLDIIKYDNAELLINSGLGLRVDISLENNKYIAFNKKFGIYGFGKKKEEAIHDFKDSIMHFFKDIFLTPEAELAESTLEIKKILSTFAILTINE